MICIRGESKYNVKAAGWSSGLHIAGASPADVVKLNVYVVGYRPEDMAAIRDAGAQFFPQRNPPAGTVLGVQSLPRDSLLIAVDAVAQMRGLFEPRRHAR